MQKLCIFYCLNPDLDITLCKKIVVFCFYRYLSEMLYSWMINTLHRADNFLLEHETVGGILLYVLDMQQTN